MYGNIVWMRHVLVLQFLLQTLVGRTDSAGKTSYSYNPKGHLAGSATLRNLYDSRDWLLATTNELGKATRLTNDLAGRAVSLTDPLAPSAMPMAGPSPASTPSSR